MKNAILTLGILSLLIVGTIMGIILLQQPENPDKPKPDFPIVGTDDLRKFNSYEELASFVKQNMPEGYSGYGYQDSVLKGVMLSPGVAVAEDSGSAQDFSQTNIQVEGVDEPDVVKNDGKYIYSITQNKIVIVRAYPAENMKVLSEISSEKEEYLSGIFLNRDSLVSFSQKYEYPSLVDSAIKCAVKGGCYDYGRGIYTTFIRIYDISDRENPKVDKEISVEGNYNNARMIGNYIYFVSQKYIERENPEPPVYVLDGVEKNILPSEVYYFDYMDNNYVFTSISALDLKNNDFETKVYLTGNTGTIYVSKDNIYLTHQKTISSRDYNVKLAQEVYLKILPENKKAEINKILEGEADYTEIRKMRKIVDDYSGSLTGDEKAEFDKKLLDALQEFEEGIAKEREKTAIHKINIDGGKISYKSAGEVPGHILNQFSMDEYEGKFRIATTTGQVWEGKSTNNLYVLDEDLKIIGEVEGLAKGEKIYSTRFMGNRAYVVTFKKVDPLFVIDLKNPEEPKVLGYLKVTGYSDYLHPYDENHLIGIGKEAIDASAEEVAGRNLDFAWYQGIKVSLFDVSDFENPKEVGKIVIGDRGTESPALYEHKAVLFDKKRNLLVLPVSLAKIDRSQYEGKEIPTNAYGELVWQGAYVLNVNPEEGVTEKGRITHMDYLDREILSKEYQTDLYDYTKQIQRSIFMDDALYTISQSKIKANKISNLDELNQIELPYEGRAEVVAN